MSIADLMKLGLPRWVRDASGKYAGIVDASGVVKKLRQNYEMPGSPTVTLESFQSFGDYAQVASGLGCTMTQATGSAVGAYGIELKSDGSNGAAAASIFGTKATQFDLSAVPGFWVITNLKYRQQAASGGCTLYFGHNATLTAYSPATTGFGRVSASVKPEGVAFGRQSRWLPMSALATLDGTPSNANPYQSIRVRMDAPTNNSPSDVVFEGLVVSKPRPKVVVSFDDGWVEAYSIAHKEARKRDIKLTHYLTAQAVGAVNHVTLAQLQEMVAYGDCLGVHGMHSTESPRPGSSKPAGNWASDLTSTSDLTQTYLYEDFQALKALGAARPELGITFQHAAYPEGALGFGTDCNIMFDRLRHLGVKTCRVSYGSVLTPIHPRYENPLALKSVVLNNSATLQQLKDAVDAAVISGGTLFIYGHRLGTAVDALTFLTADFQALLDYICSRRNAGLLDVPTMKEWYEDMNV